MSPAARFSRIKSSLLALGLACLPIAANAGREVLLDLPGSDYSLNGQSWGAYQSSTTFSNTLGGVSAGTSASILNTGAIVFAGTGFFFDVALLPANGVYTLNPGDSFSTIGINIGQVDARVFDPTLVNDHVLPYTQPYSAARYNYNDVCVNNACFTFQVIDIHLAAGVDVLEFNYASATLPPGATTSFSVTPYTSPSPFLSTAFPFGPTLCLKNGTQTVFTSITSCAAGALAVPEPDVAVLLALGALGLAVGLRRRQSVRGRSIR